MMLSQCTRAHGLLLAGASPRFSQGTAKQENYIVNRKDEGPVRKKRTGPFFSGKSGARDVLGLVALRPLAHLELHVLPFRKRLIAIHLDRGEMDENVLSRLALDEAVSLCGIEPLHNTRFSTQLRTPMD